MISLMFSGSGAFPIVDWSLAFAATVAIEASILAILRPKADTVPILRTVFFLNLTTHPAAWTWTAYGLPAIPAEIIVVAVEVLLFRRVCAWPAARLLGGVLIANIVSAATYPVIPALLGR